ncbi:hypothetical protein ACIBQ5_33080 [Streptomyces massasporeus]|uniref:hypothetical protein n=1 Tax=Streptomyces massasporeus TaxID=67324 RepID=UPI00379271C3
MAVEAEQRAWEEQGEDRNHELFLLILDVRDVLGTNGVSLGPGTAVCSPTSGAALASASGCHVAEPVTPVSPEPPVELPDG